MFFHLYIEACSVFSTPVIYHNREDCDRFRPSDKGLGSHNMNKNRVYLPKFIWQWKTLRYDCRSFQTAGDDILDASAVSVLCTFSMRFSLYISWMSQDYHNNSTERWRKLNGGLQDKLHFIWAFLDGEGCASVSSSALSRKLESHTTSRLQEKYSVWSHWGMCVYVGERKLRSHAFIHVYRPVWDWKYFLYRTFP